MSRSFRRGRRDWWSVRFRPTPRPKPKPTVNTHAGVVHDIAQQEPVKECPLFVDCECGGTCTPESDYPVCDTCGVKGCVCEFCDECKVNVNPYEHFMEWNPASGAHISQPAITGIEKGVR